MIIETLAKLDDRKRISAAVLVVLVIAGICYYAITRESVVKLQANRAKYAGIQAAYAGTKNQQADFLNLQKQLEDEKKQVRGQEQKCFSNEQALQFFENINTIALTHNLKPISRTISESKGFLTDKKTKLQQQFLKTQSAKVTVVGNYSDIVNFVRELTNRPQKVCITNLHIGLPAGEKSNPRASFSISVLIQAFSTLSHKVQISTEDNVNATVADNSKTDGQIPASSLTVLRNPMQFGSAAQEETGKLIVKGILYCKDNPCVVIGTKIVREGDEILGATIVKINKDSVEFEMNGRRWTEKVQD